MTAEKDDKETNQADMQPRIRWDSSNMRSAYVNVLNVAGAREEVVLLFGKNQNWGAERQELKVHLTTRIIMSPFAAKRLCLLLNNRIKDYEKRYGILDVEGSRPETPTLH